MKTETGVAMDTDAEVNIKMLPAIAIGRDDTAAETEADDEAEARILASKVMLRLMMQAARQPFDQLWRVSLRKMSTRTGS